MTARSEVQRLKVTAFWFLICSITVALVTPTPLRAEKEFEIFDGRVYNGKYYPRIDIIEWGEPSHMEFHVYWKGKPVEMSFQLDESKGKKVMLVNYHIKDRKEHLCRRVLAPGHFSEKFLVYKDTSDKDMDAVIVSMAPLPEKKGRVLLNAPQYASCEMSEPDRFVAGEKNDPATKGHIAPPAAGPKNYKSDKGSIKKKDAAVPFSDW
ncbi:MAG: hypothetical protein AB1540_11790 [Bdellovibrionota bacterium]